MSHIRITIKLHEGHEGVPLTKLAAFSKDATELFNQVAQDCRIAAKKDEWVAVQFRQGSVELVAELYHRTTPGKVAAFRQTFPRVLGCAANNGAKPQGASKSAIRLAQRLMNRLEPAEKARFGLWKNGNEREIDWFDLIGDHASDEEESTEESYYGFIQGNVHSVVTEEEGPCIVVKDALTSKRIHCYFEPWLYKQIHDIVKDLYVFVNVEGWIDVSPDGKRTMRNLKSIERPDPMTEADVDRLFGIAPNITGPLNLQEYIDEVRGRE